jgi:hypothetical protein
MKKLLFGLLLVCGVAHAERWYEMENQAGGKIILLSGFCEEDENSGRMVISTTRTGENLNGCWFFFADMIHIVWEGGKTSSFDPKWFRVKGSKK